MSQMKMTGCLLVALLAMSAPVSAQNAGSPATPPAPPAAAPENPAQPVTSPTPPTSPTAPAADAAHVTEPAQAEEPPHGANDDADDHDDDDKGKSGKTSIKYKPRKGITVRAGKAKLNFFLGAETVMQWGHCAGDACAASDALSIHVRRARFAMEAKLPHHLSLDFAIQVKNEILVLKNAYMGWKKDGLTLKAGFFKPPGGLERDSSTWVKPFPERSVVANFKQDRIIGVGASKWLADHTVKLSGAAGHPPVGNFDAFEPEDVVLPPPGIEEEDLTTDPGNWDLFATAAYAPSDNFEIGLNTTAHISPDAGKGPNFSEPYETKVLGTRFIKGAFLAAGADVSWHNQHMRASAEVVGFHSGETIPHVDMAGNPIEPVSTTNGIAGYTVLGFTPNGEYGPAIENSPLLHGYQFLLRGEFLRVTPGVTDDTTALFSSITGGVEWQTNANLRLQTDLAVQHYNENVDPSNHNVWRTYAEVWAQVLL
jgi:hypothetical protein